MYGWHPGIGDPTFLGWLTVAAYSAAAILCFRCYRRSAPVAPHTRESIMISRARRPFWLGTTIVLALLAINKQLDLQSFFTAAARALAKAEGWYEMRRTAQFIFIVAVASVEVSVAILSLWLFRKGGVWVHLAQAGLITLCTFVTIRAASFHHVDAMLGSGVWYFSLNHILELAGIVLIAAAAIGAGSRPE